MHVIAHICIWIYRAWWVDPVYFNIATTLDPMEIQVNGKYKNLP